MKSQNLDLDVSRIKAGWSEMEPSEDFADRVLARLDPPLLRRRGRSLPQRALLCAAVAMALLSALPLVLSRSIVRHPATSQSRVELDLGFER